MPIEQIGLDQELTNQLEQEAKRRGVTPEELAAELIRKELASRTKPRNPRGNVKPFHIRS